MSARWLVDPAAVVLGTVSPEQRELARNLIAADPEFRAAVDRLRTLTETLGELPARAWQAGAEDVPPLDLETVLASRPAGAAGPGRDPGAGAIAVRARRRLSLRPAAAVLAALALLAAGMGAGALLRGGNGTQQARTRADTDPWVLASLRPLPRDTRSDAAGRVALTLHPGGRARMRMHDLPANPPGTYYEAWLMTDDRNLVALGTFRVDRDGRASVDFGFGADPRRYRYVDVSLQRADGGPGHSGDSVLRTDVLG